MNTIRELNKWANAHTSITVDILRIVFGVFLFVKGASFVSSNVYLSEILDKFRGFGGEMILFHYVAFAHMVGGVLITSGLFTRWSIWVQLPIIICAVLINFIGDFNLNNFIQASIALLLSIFFSFYGGGKHSADYHFKMEQ